VGANARVDDGPYLRLSGITKSFGRFQALHGIDLAIERGELVTFLGPSGCGKTTLLRIVAGLETQDTGSIVQDGRDISRLPAIRRDYGIVFQSYALFPNLTIDANVAYGLVNRRKGRDEIERRVAELLKLVGLPDSGGLGVSARARVFCLQSGLGSLVCSARFAGDSVI